MTMDSNLSIWISHLGIQNAVKDAEHDALFHKYNTNRHVVFIYSKKVLKSYIILDKQAISGNLHKFSNLL